MITELLFLDPCYHYLQIEKVGIDIKTNGIMTNLV